MPMAWVLYSKNTEILSKMLIALCSVHITFHNILIIIRYHSHYNINVARIVETTLKFSQNAQIHLKKSQKKSGTNISPISPHLTPHHFYATHYINLALLHIPPVKTHNH